MPIVTLRDLYVAELQDLYDAEQQVLQELPGMAARATSGELRSVFETHYEQTQVHIERLDLLFRQLNERMFAAPCEAIRGLIREAHRRAAEAERGEVLDAALIAAAQRIEHYEIAAYGCARTYAQVLGDAEARRLLQQTLDEEGETDHRLTAIAEQGINQAAGEDLTARPTTYRSRLRYIAGVDLPAFRFGSHRITNADGDDLGRIDGFIVDGESGRPVYHVVDSGGWFSGRRYVIPVAQLEPEATEAAFRTELTREQLRRYPEFSPSAFVAMDDEDAARYERRLLDAVLPYRHEVRRGDRPRYDELPLYQPPGWLMSGVWMTDATLAGAIPISDDDVPQADQPATRERRRRQASARQSPHDDRTEAEHQQMQPENELMMARGEPDGRGEHAEEQASDQRRIEKYSDR
jgi:ferritin-like metal-binding protein YciE